MPTRKPTGIYWYGPVYDISGYGNVSRNFLKSIEEIGIPVFIHPHGAFDKEIGEDTIKWIENLSTIEIGDNPFLIQHSDPYGFRNPKTINPLMSFSKNIGMTIFETDRISDEWVYRCNMMDEIWIPTQFNYETFKNSGVSEKKLKIVRYPIDTNIFNADIDYGKFDFNTDIEGFKFLYVSGYDYRKGYELLLESFCEAFTGDDDVSLILQVYVPSWADNDDVIEIFNTIVSKYDSKPNIYLSLGKISSDDLLKLYNTADAYISTERASGWGMPEMEMMALGKPVATIDWGGTTEFMNETNHFPISPNGEFELVDIRLQTSRPVYYGHKWASVDKEEVIKTLKELYHNKEKREKISNKAKLDIVTKFSCAAIGVEILQSLGLF